MLPLVHPLHLVLGFAIWSLWFVLSYAGLSLACQFAPPTDASMGFTWINALLLLGCASTTALLVYLALRCWRAPAPREHPQQARFVSRVAGGAYLAAAIATLAVGLPSVWLPPCL